MLVSLTRLKPPWEMRSIWSGIHPCECFAAFRPITLLLGSWLSAARRGAWAQAEIPENLCAPGHLATAAVSPRRMREHGYAI
jgi:hypothetical protein